MTPRSFVFLRLLTLRRQALLAWSRFRDPATPLGAKLLLVAAAAYIIMPFDLVPDFLPLLGWLDDAAMVPIALSLFERFVGRSPRHA